MTAGLLASAAALLSTRADTTPADLARLTRCTPLDAARALQAVRVDMAEGRATVYAEGWGDARLRVAVKAEVREWAGLV